MSEEKNQTCNELSFDTLGINEKVLRGVYSYGFEKPSIIQQTAIRPLIDGCDVIGQAQSGTGKTAILKDLNSAIDLEGHAHHRGSAFGGLSKGQPTVINFENNCIVAIRHA